jgi:hypothetical protein
VLGADESNLVYSKLTGFLNEPFYAVRIFRRRDCNMNTKIFFWFGCFGVDDESTAGKIGISDNSLIEKTCAIGNNYRVPLPGTQDLNTMPRLFSVKIINALGQEWLIKQIHALGVLLKELVNKSDVFFFGFILAHALQFFP